MRTAVEHFRMFIAKQHKHVRRAKRQRLQGKDDFYNSCISTIQRSVYCSLQLLVKQPIQPNKPAMPAQLPTLEKCFRPCLSSNCGGGFCNVINNTFKGGNLAKGACPLASSNIVMPNDQMSADELYLHGNTTAETCHRCTFWPARITAQQP